MPYDCFISYASADLDYAEELHRRLAAEGLTIWFDKVRLEPGFDWHREIEQGCENSRVFLPVLTPRWKQSEWTKFETYGAEAVIPLIFEGTWTEVCTPPLERFQAEIIDLTHPDASTWKRLSAAIRRELANPIPQKASRLTHLRHRPNPHFVGREKDLIRLHEELHVNPRAVLTQGRVRVVVALGGVGKTTLARHYAEKFWRCYPQMFWVDARLGLETGFARLHDLLFPERAALGLSDTDKAGRALYELSSQDTRLLIIDNAEDEQSVMAWIPKSGGCHTLITSRFAAWSAAVKTLYLYVLEPEPARELLFSRAGRQGSVAPDQPPGELEAVDKLAWKLGYLPLALEQAAAYIRQEGTEFGFADYLELYSQAQRELLAQGALGSTEYPDPVITTWKPTVDKMTPAARAVLRLSAFLAPTPIPQEYFVKSADLVRREAETFPALAATAVSSDAAGDAWYVRQAVGQLKAYSLVQSEGRGFTVHPLVQTVERLIIPPEELLPPLQNTVSLINTARPESTDPEHRPAWEVLLLHSECLIQHLRDTAGAALDDGLLHGAAQAYELKGWFNQAVSYAREWADLNRERLGPEHQETIGAEAFLGYYLWSGGQYREAEPLLVRVLAFQEKVLGPEHPDVATTLNNLAVLYRDQGRFPEAEPLYQRCLAISEKVLGPEHPHVAASLNNLAALYYAQGRFPEAEPRHHRAMAIREKVLGPEHPDVGNSLNSLAMLYYAQGRFPEAEPLYHRAMAIREKVLGPEHPHVATTLNNLAELYQAQGRFPEAEPLYQRALAISEKILGPEHPDTVETLFNLAQCLWDAGNYPEAASYYRRMVQVAEGISQRGQELTEGMAWLSAVSHNNLAFHTEVPARNWPAAEEHYRRSLELLHQIGQSLEAVNVEMNLQTLFHLSGQAVDVERVKELTRILEEAGDKRAEKGRKLLSELGQTE